MCLGIEMVLVHNKPYCLWLKQWKKYLTERNVGAQYLLIFQRSTFDTRNDDLLLAKLHEYGLKNQ